MGAGRLLLHVQVGICIYSEHPAILWNTVVTKNIFHIVTFKHSCFLWVPSLYYSNGSMSSSTSTTFGETNHLSCESGYTLSGSATITCQASGSWETPPVCSMTGESLVHGRRNQGGKGGSCPPQPNSHLILPPLAIQ